MYCANKKAIMNKKRTAALIAAALLGIQSLAAAAADPQSQSQSADTLRLQGYSVKSISPIFGQLLMMAMPAGFTPVFENTNGGHYIREAVLQGETTDKWTQMLTVTGDKGWSSNASLSPAKFAQMKAGSFKAACPASFSALATGAGKIGGHDAFAAVLSCGTSPATGGATSESALFVIIKGEADYYTIQWAERGEKSATPIDITPAKWLERLKQLNPIRLCPIIQGEAAPYPSCVDQN
jgi:hypothetical protein